MAITIQDGQTAEKLSGETLVYEFDYDAERLATGVELASVGTFTLDPDDAHISSDNEALVTGNRKVHIRIAGGKANKTYIVLHSGVTNETPSQTVKSLFYLFIRPEQ